MNIQEIITMNTLTKLKKLKGKSHVIKVADWTENAGTWSYFLSTGAPNLSLAYRYIFETYETKGTVGNEYDERVFGYAILADGTDGYRITTTVEPLYDVTLVYSVLEY